MLLIITGSNCTFTPGYWQSSLKRANNGVPFFLTANRKPEISLSDLLWNLAGMFLFQILGQSWQEVIWSCRSVTAGCSSPRSFFNKKHNSPLIVPLLPGLFWWHFASPMKAGEILIRQLLRDHGCLKSFNLGFVKPYSGNTFILSETTQYNTMNYKKKHFNNVS